MRAGKFDLLVGSFLLAVSSVAGSVAFAFHDAPLETDAALTLVGAHWVANDLLSTSVFTYSVHFTDGDGYEYDSIKMFQTTTGSVQHILGFLPTGSSTYTIAWRNSVWGEDYYKELYFTGGDDVGNADLISWLKSNGSLYYSYDQADSMVSSAYGSGFNEGATGYSVAQDLSILFNPTGTFASTYELKVYVSYPATGVETVYTLNSSNPSLSGLHRNADEVMELVIECHDADDAWIDMGIAYQDDRGNSFALWRGGADESTGNIYLPVDDSSPLLYVSAYQNSAGGTQYLGSWDFAFDVSHLDKVLVGTGYYTGFQDGYGSGNSAGYRSGYNDGYGSGQNVGASAGYSNGYSVGYDNGYAAGYAEDGAPVIDIWRLLSTVVTMPFTFFSQGLDWTLFQGTQYEFSVSIFFGSLLVLLMLWKVIQLIIGFGK